VKPSSSFRRCQKRSSMESPPFLHCMRIPMTRIYMGFRSRWRAALRFGAGIRWEWLERT